MNQSFYTAAAGAYQQQQRLNVQGNNIANVNNNGFKAERVSFAALMNRGVNGIDNVRVPVGAGVRVEQTATDHRTGAMASTGRALDFAIQGDGFFALVDPASGQVSYTRTGEFVLSEFQVPTEETDENGVVVLKTVNRLADAEGRFVLNRQGGTIDVTDPEAELPVGVFDFTNYDGMEHIGKNLFVPAEKNGQLRLGAGVVRQGVLELSNVDLAEELTKVIEAQRTFGIALKMVQTSDEVETTVNSLRT